MQGLVPYLEETMVDGDYFFWPDLASCHYANATQDFTDRKYVYCTGRTV